MHYNVDAWNAFAKFVETLTNLELATTKTDYFNYESTMQLSYAIADLHSLSRQSNLD